MSALKLAICVSDIKIILGQWPPDRNKMLNFLSLRCVSDMKSQNVFIFRGRKRNLIPHLMPFTARIRRMGEGNIFSFDCQFTPRGYPSPMFFPRSFLGGGTTVPGSFPGHWSQVLSRGTPVPGSFPGHRSQVLSGWVLQSWGVPSPSWGYSSMRLPPARSGWDTPSHDRTGVPPVRTGVLLPQDRTAKWALATQRAVCL